MPDRLLCFDILFLLAFAPAPMEDFDGEMAEDERDEDEEDEEDDGDDMNLEGDKRACVFVSLLLALCDWLLSWSSATPPNDVCLCKPFMTDTPSATPSLLALLALLDKSMVSAAKMACCFDCNIASAPA